MKIVNTRVNHLLNPVGYQFPHVTFSYAVEEAQGKKQTAAQIVIYADEQQQKVLYDTGKDAGISSLAHNIDLKLEPCTRYYWNVRVWSDVEGEEAVSDLQYFETGKMDQPWQAQWIGCDDSEPRHPVFHKKVDLDPSRKVCCARLYISGLGLYRAWIAGKMVGDEFLAPYCNNYHAWIQYQTYDVTEQVLALGKGGECCKNAAAAGIRTADDEITVALGNGWYKGRFGFDSQPGGPAYYGDSWKLIAELHVYYEDGTCQVIGTDDSWTVDRCNITFSNIYDGEKRDDTLPAIAPVPAAALGSVEALKDSLPLTERLSIPVRRKEFLTAASLIDTPAGEKVFDLGQNQAGTFRLRVHEPAGTTIHVQVGEVLQQGNFYRDNLRSALAEYWYVSDGNEHVLEPMFTFYGYRYAKVEGASGLKADDFTGVTCYSDFTNAGTLTTGVEKINKLISNIFWGQKGNFIDVPTDCPQRDERMGWTADTQVFVPTACYYSDPYAFYNKYLFDMHTEQAEKGGLVPDVVPAFKGNGSGSSVWGDAATIIPWTLYEFYGDVNILRDSIEGMKAWVDWVTEADGDNHAYGQRFHFGDWLALDNPAGGVDQVKGGTEDAFVANVYYYHSADLVARSAKILGDKEGEEKYRALADKIYSYIESEYFTPNGRLAIDTQTGYVLALFYSLTPYRERQLDGLTRLLKIHGNKFVTGFVGTPLIQKVLSLAGRDKLAYRILFNEEFPGWLYEINLGATTVWERWNSMSPDGSVSSTGMNSFNHYAYGSVGEWMFRTIGGINSAEEGPGFKKATLRPVPNYDLRCASCAYPSPAGTYATSWDVIDYKHVHMSVTVPFDCTAVLYLPQAKADTILPWSGKELGSDRCVELSAGTYELTYEADDNALVTIYTVDFPVGEILDDKKVMAALMKEFPQISQLPLYMAGAPMRALLTQFMGDTPQSAALMERLNTIMREAVLA